MSEPVNNTTTITPEPPAAAPAAPPMLPVQIPQQDCPLTFNTRQGLEALQRAARLFCSSPLVPKEYQGAEGLPSCAIALDLANRIGANPLMVMQNLFIVHNRPGWSSKFLIATFNQCGRFSPIRYEFFGNEGEDDWGCRAWATERATNHRLEGPKVTIKIAKAEGWVDKSGSKWKTMPEQMLRYRSAAWFVNTVAPELSMGLPTTDEVEDIEGEVINDPPRAGALPNASLPALPAGPASPQPAAAAATPAASGRLARLRQPKDVTPEPEAEQPVQPAGNGNSKPPVNTDDKIQRGPAGQALLQDPNEVDLPWPEE